MLEPQRQLPWPSEASTDMNITIALVEDDAALATLLSYNLSAAGFEVEWVRCGEDAEEKLLGTAKHDLILLDWQLPGRSGIELLRQIRSTEPTERQPIIMLTCHNNSENRKRAYDLGATDFIGKPFSLHALMARITSLLDPQLKPAIAESR